MNRTWNVWLITLLIAAGAAACKKNDSPDPSGEVANVEINRWVTEQMRDIYYWNTSIPANRNLNFSVEPLTFFDRILHPDDRFSWMQKADELDDNLSGISTTVGLGIGLIQVAQNSDRVVIAVRYALEGSPAALKGIQRGDFILTIDGRELTTSNYNQVLNIYYGAAPFRVEIGKLENNQLISKGEIMLNPVERFQEQAIHLDTMYVTPTGRKVGYLFYNRFLNNQTDALIRAFRQFKQDGIEELVLDLRYNNGGGIYVSGVLSGMIHSNFQENDVFIRYKYNSNYRDEDYSYNRLFGGASEHAAEREAAARIVSEIKAANLGLDRVFILATENSASASELVINNLRPFLSDANVVHIGTRTVGKNEGSLTIKDERNPPRIDWAIQPIVVKLANRAGFGDYPEGLVPTLSVDEWKFLPWVPIGSIEDPLLSRALGLIDPALQALHGKTMQVRAERTRLLGAKPLKFEDRNNRVTPVQIGTTARPDRQEPR